MSVSDLFIMRGGTFTSPTHAPHLFCIFTWATNQVIPLPTYQRRPMRMNLPREMFLGLDALEFLT